jgi:hypothetical protein
MYDSVVVARNYWRAISVVSEWQGSFFSGPRTSGWNCTYMRMYRFWAESSETTPEASRRSSSMSPLFRQKSTRVSHSVTHSAILHRLSVTGKPMPLPPPSVSWQWQGIPSFSQSVKNTIHNIYSYRCVICLTMVRTSECAHIIDAATLGLQQVCR